MLPPSMCASAQPTDRPERGLCEFDGCRLAFALRGTGVPVLLIQGVGVGGDGWNPLIDLLAASCRCLSFDNRGFGRSNPAGRPITVPQMAADALALLDACGWPAAHVVGHSLGGLVAQHLALANPARVKSLSLLCTVARGRDATRLSPALLWRGLRSRIGPRRQRRRAFLELVAAPQELRDVDRDELAARLAPLFGHDLADQPPVVAAQLAALRAYDATPRLRELAGRPTLVLSAEHDCIAPPRFGRALAAGIPGARYVEIDGAAHGVIVLAPRTAAAPLLETIARSGESAAPRAV